MMLTKIFRIDQVHTCLYVNSYLLLYMLFSEDSLPVFTDCLNACHSCTPGDYVDVMMEKRNCNIVVPLA